MPQSPPANAAAREMPGPTPDALALAVLAASPAPMALVDAGGWLAGTNQAANALVGNGGPLPMRVVDWLGLDAPGERLLHDALRAAPPPRTLRLKTRRADGTTARLLARLTAAGPGSGLILVLEPAAAWPEGETQPDGLGDADLEEAPWQLSLAVDLAGIGIFRQEASSGHLWGNEQFMRMAGLEPAAGGVPVGVLRAQIHPDDIAQERAQVGKVRKGGGPVDAEVRFRHADGVWHTVLVRRMLQRDARGEPRAFVGVALDITERQQASARALELGRRFEMATRAAGIGHWRQEEGADRAVWSDQLYTIHGLEPGSPVPTLKEWIEQHVHPEDRHRVLENMRVRNPSASVEGDLRVVRPDGSVRHLITHALVENEHGVPLRFGIVMDVTERVAAEAALRQANERAALAARGAGLGTWTYEFADGSVFWDEQMFRLRGLEPRPAPLDEAERLALVHPDDRELATSFASSVVRAGNTSYEFRVRLPDGSWRWLASRSQTVADADGRPLRRIGVNWDVTDIRSAEAARQERAMALRESQAKSQFLARMSHELRTPLNAVLGFTQLLLTEDPAEDPGASSRRRRLEHIRSAGQHLLSLIDDVLDLSTLEGGEVRVSLGPVALAPLVAETLPLLEPLLRARQVRIETGGLDVQPLADERRLRQVLINLLSNAIKYNRDGGLVRVEAARRGGTVLLRVTDTGRGMTDEQMRHLFEPFNRLGIEREGIEGTGIGLAIVKALVEKMGGSVHADSTPGQGSLFELRLADAAPASPPRVAPPPEPGPAPAPTAPRGSRATLLYVEDNPVNALIVAELIARRPDLTLHVAVDGQTGVERALELRPDLLLLDMQLPDIDGYEVIRRLRADARTAEIPCIALSANAMPQDIERALQAGVAEYWTKPLDFRAFMASLEKLFGPPPEPPGPR